MPLKFTLFFILIVGTAQAQIITTVAGNGNGGYSGDGGPATAAQINWEHNVVVDNLGNIYISDLTNNVIRKVNAAGIISTYAGTGTLGYSGDNGLATASNLYHPAYLALDNSNNLYFTDQGSSVIRKVDNITGIITSITGNLPTGYSGDGGPLLAAQFHNISGINFDNSGNLYITDFYNFRIRKVNTLGIINTVVGNGTNGFSGDGGVATLAQIGGAYAVAFDNVGNMYIPDNGNCRIRKVTPSGIITSYAGNGNFNYNGDGSQATLASIGTPWTVDIDNSGNLYIGDSRNYVVRKVDPAGIISTYAGTGVPGNTGDGGPATMAQLGVVSGVHVDPLGNLLISIRENYYVIRKVLNCSAPVINTDPNDVSICDSTNAAFAVNAANSASFLWEENKGQGWLPLNDNSVYSGVFTNNLNITNANYSMNSYKYRCNVINQCVSIVSNHATLSILPSLSTTINIATASDTICSGTNTLFTAACINAGTTPIYHWKKNGFSVGNNDSLYMDNSLVNGDIIYCEILSSNICATNTIAVSNNISIAVNSIAVPAISISSSSTNICLGTPVQFISVTQNAGQNPYFQWQKNGINVGDNLSTYIDSNIIDGDIVTCILSSNLVCISQPHISSNAVTLHVVPAISPSVSITSSNPVLCSGDSCFFRATTQDISNELFQWKKNGINIGSNNNLFSDRDFHDGDIVSCIVSGSNNCSTTSFLESNSIVIKALAKPVSLLNKNGAICSGTSRTLTAGDFVSYLWNTGSTNKKITVQQLGTYSFTATDSNGCRISDTVIITTFSQPPKGFISKDTSICKYNSVMISPVKSFVSYNWSNNSSNSFLKVENTGQYWLEVMDNNGCSGRDTIVITAKDCMSGFYIPNAIHTTTNNNTKNFKPLIFGNLKKYHFKIYNRWGQVIFESTDSHKGWDGILKGSYQDSQVFVWVCMYQLDNYRTETKKGTVILIR